MILVRLGENQGANCLTNRLSERSLFELSAHRLIANSMPDKTFFKLRSTSINGCDIRVSAFATTHSVPTLCIVAHDTIIAVSSPPGSSWRGLIRLTGPDALRCLKHLTSDSADVPGRITASRLKGTGLSVLVMTFHAPRSFTGEDVVEIQLPGHPALLERVLRQCIRLEGVRLAEPGEFTYRAFANRRIDLTQAEGIAATIAATNDAQLRAAGQLRLGQLGQFAERHVETLAQILALVEAGIDFTDQDDVVPITADRLFEQVTQVRQDLSDLLSRSHAWGELGALPRVVLIGPPSAGKSTLFNALLAKERAVIDAMPGTTRDVLAEPWHLRHERGDTQQVMLVDVAGLSPTGQPVESGLLWAGIDASAQAAARSQIERADVVLVLRPADEPAVEHQWSLPASVKRLDVMTKMDLGRGEAFCGDEPALQISAISGDGLDALQTAVWHALGERGSSLSAESMALGPRHEACLREALSNLDEVLLWIEPSVGGGGAVDHVEMVAAGLRGGLDALAALGGVMSPDDVIGKVFATFCVGK